MGQKVSPVSEHVDQEQPGRENREIATGVLKQRERTVLCQARQPY